MIDIRSLGYDPKIIVSKYEQFESLVKANKKLKAKLQESEKVMQHYRRKSDEEEIRWKDHDDAFVIFTSLIKAGLKAQDIFMVVHILKNDFPQSEIKQLTDDIITYGNIAAAKWKLKREYSADTESLF